MRARPVPQRRAKSHVITLWRLDLDDSGAHVG